jgi:WhiB family redox-sensing transcriptional regulator
MWTDFAACRGIDTEIFFPERREDEDMAKKICAGCGVRNDCLEQALRFGERYGIYAGLSPKERWKE